MPTNKLLDGIICWKVQYRQVYSQIKEYHLGGIQYSRLVMYLLRKGHFRKAVHCRKPLAIFMYHEPPLKATEVAKAKDYENAISFPVNLIQRLSLCDSLCQEIRSGSFRSSNTQLKGKWVFLNETFSFCGIGLLDRLLNGSGFE